MSGDLISRQAVLDAIEELKKIHFDRVVVLNKVRDRALELPSVTPQEPKTGHWIVHPKGGIFTQLICDKCLLSAHYDCRNYCPNCGARMVEPQESEE